MRHRHLDKKGTFDAGPVATAPMPLAPASGFPFTIEITSTNGTKALVPFLSAIVLDMSLDGRNIEIRTEGRTEGSNRHQSIPRELVQGIHIDVRQS